MKLPMWHVLSSVGSHLATYSKSTLVLLLITAVGFALYIGGALDFDFEITSRLFYFIFVSSMGLIPILFPCIAGWLSQRLRHVVLFPVILVSILLIVAVFRYDRIPLDRLTVSIVSIIAQSSIAFTAGWGMRYMLRKTIQRIRSYRQG